MATNAKPVYKRILLKLSGEALQGTEGDRKSTRLNSSL